MAKTTIRQVATAAGVSPSSVSRSLRGVGGTSGQTADRIRRAALDLGYTAASAGRRFGKEQGGTVAVVMPYLSRWFFAELLGGIERTVHAAGLGTLLYHAADIEMRQSYFASGLLRRRVDGVIVACLALTGPEVSSLQGLGVPVGTVGTRVESFSNITVDEAKGARTAVQHLLNLGHRRVGFISGEPREPVGFTAPLRRRDGYREALVGAGLRPDPELEASGPYSVDGGEEAAMQLLGRSELPSAIFAECDEMAFGVMRALKRVGLRVPEDMSLVGFDDHPMAANLDLTTISQEVAGQGAAIASHLVEAMVRGTKARVDLTAPTRLVVRSSTEVSREEVPPQQPPAHEAKARGRAEMPAGQSSPQGPVQRHGAVGTRAEEVAKPGN